MPKSVPFFNIALVARSFKFVLLLKVSAATLKELSKVALISSVNRATSSLTISSNCAVLGKAEAAFGGNSEGSAAACGCE